MNVSSFEELGLVCPRCRKATNQGLFTSKLKIGKVIEKKGDDILEGFLKCENPQCSFEYPILEGVPCVIKDMENWVKNELGLSYAFGRSCSSMERYFKDLTKKSSSNILEESHLGAYLDSHYGEFAVGSFQRQQWESASGYWDKIVEFASPGQDKKYGLSLDVGCSVGRCTFELARLSRIAVGLDLRFEPVRLAAKFEREKKVVVHRRVHGLKFEEYETSFKPSQNAFFMVADCLDPPFTMEQFDVVTSLNLIDTIKFPLMLLGQINALLCSGGTLVLSSPYEWRADITNPVEWLDRGDLDGPLMLRGILEGNLLPELDMKYDIEKVLDAVWSLRNHDRYWSIFLVNLIRAKKKTVSEIRR
jgi:SAM-dependent methyltransferase